MPREIAETGGTCPAGAEVRVEKVAGMPAEGYELFVTTNGVTIRHSDAAGLFYAKTTLDQLLNQTIPCVEIKDSPAYRWRGVMVDEARHFLGKETVKKVLDLMGQYKLNVLHWHLVDDQGWRIEIKRHPELVEYGAVRPASVAYGPRPMARGKGGIRWEYSDERYGPYFYTQDDIREIIAYAAARHITVVPEIEIPGHVRALLAARPDLGCRGEALERRPRIAWGVESDVLCAGNDAAVRYMEEIFDEVCALFPSEYIHIGGDECPTVRWKKCPKCQARKAALGLGDERGLQAWMTAHFAEYLAKKGKRPVGWDEALCGDVPRNMVGMKWRMSGKGDGYVSTETAIARGFDMILTPSGMCYYSRPQGIPDDPFPYYSPNSNLTLEKAYSFDPMAGLPQNARSNVLGGQASMWTEFIWNRFDLEYKMWPRTLAMAEALWTAPPTPRDYKYFRRRALAHRKRLIVQHVNCAPIPIVSLSTAAAQPSCAGLREIEVLP